MTTQKSSLNTFSFSFFSALKEGFIIPLIAMLALILAVPTTSLFSILELIKQGRDPMTGALIEGEQITDKFRFYIFDEYSALSNNILMHLLVIAASILLGIIMFRFIANKKTVNVYYSLGIKRENLFASKFLAGLLLLFVSVSIPFLLTFLINIKYFGYSKELLATIIFHVLGYFVLALVAFTLTATVFSAVGTIMEGIAFSGILMLGPTIAYYSAQFLMDKLTLGSPYGHFYSSENMLTNSLASGLARFNPLMFFYTDITQHGYLALEYDEKKKLIWQAPSYTNIIIWALIALALFFIGMVIFKKRKAEICGFLGENKWLNFIATFLIGFFPIGISIMSIPSLPLGILVGALIFILLYLIVDFALIRNFKEWIKGLYKLPIHLGIVFAIIAIFYTGIFGFSSRMPALEKIESIDISFPGNTMVISPLRGGGFGEDFTLTFDSGEQINGFKSKADLEMIRSLHKQILADGKISTAGLSNQYMATNDSLAQDIKISYKLKNGNDMRRFYGRIKYDTLLKMLELDMSDRYKELVSLYLTQAPKDSDGFNVERSKMIFQDENMSFALYSSKLNVKKSFDLELDKREELRKALAADLTEQTLEQRYFPKDQALGVLHLLQGSQKFDDEYFDEADPTDDEVILDTEVEDSRIPEEHMIFSVNYYEGVSFVITPDMKRTVDFLKSNDLYDFFLSENDLKVVAADIVGVKTLRDKYYYSTGMTMLFNGGWNKNNNYDKKSDYYSYGDFAGVYKTTDEKLVNEIEKGAHLSYFTALDGFYVRFTLADKAGYTTMYVPRQNMPASVAKAVDEHKIESPDFGSPYHF